jgi:hypothetical protein
MAVPYRDWVKRVFPVIVPKAPVKADTAECTEESSGVMVDARPGGKGEVLEVGFGLMS